MDLKIKIDKASVNELISEISKAVEKTVKETLEKTNQHNVRENDELLTRNEVMKMLKISHATLYHYQENGTIPHKKIGRRVYFKKEDIIDNPELDGY